MSGTSLVEQQSASERGHPETAEHHQGDWKHPGKKPPKRDQGRNAAMRTGPTEKLGEMA